MLLTKTAVTKFDMYCFNFILKTLKSGAKIYIFF